MRGCLGDEERIQLRAAARLWDGLTYISWLCLLAVPDACDGSGTEQGKEEDIVRPREKRRRVKSAR